MISTEKNASKRLHICMLELGIPPRTIGGAEMQAWEHARRLATRHDVTILLRKESDEAAEELRDGVRILRIPVAPSPFRLLSHLFRYLCVIRSLRREIDVILAFRAIPNGIVSALASILWDIPGCVSPRGLDWYSHLASPVGRAALRWIALHNRALHAQTPRIAADLLKLATAVRPVVIPNGLELTGENVHGDSVVYVGGLTPHKGIPCLLQAMRQLPDKNLLIAGDGPERPSLERMAEGMNVTFAGLVQPHDVRRLMVDTARVLVLPTLTSEGMPNVILEAMALHLPVITTSVPGGSGDLVQHEKTGLLVPPADSGALASAIERLYANAHLRQRITANAHDQVQSCGWGTVIAQWESLLRGLAA